MENNAQKKRKFNIVDLIFILILVALVAVVAVKFLNNAKAKTASSEYVVVIHSDDIPSTALSGFKVGDKVQDDVGKTFGVVEKASGYVKKRSSTKTYKVYRPVE